MYLKLLRKKIRWLMLIILFSAAAAVSASDSWLLARMRREIDASKSPRLDMSRGLTITTNERIHCFLSRFDHQPSCLPRGERHPETAVSGVTAHASCCARAALSWHRSGKVPSESKARALGVTLQSAGRHAKAMRWCWGSVAVASSLSCRGPLVPNYCAVTT